MSHSFNVTKANVQLKLALTRIPLHKQKRKALNTQLKKEIQKLIQDGQDEKARAKIVHVIREDYYLGVLNELELHCETLQGRVGVFQTQISCPIDLKVSVCSIVFAAPYLDNNPELMTLRTMFIKKFGNEFPNECVLGCCIPSKILNGLSKSMPDEILIQYYIKMLSEVESDRLSFEIPDKDTLKVSVLDQVDGKANFIDRDEIPMNLVNQGESYMNNQVNPQGVHPQGVHPQGVHPYIKHPQDHSIEQDYPLTLDGIFMVDRSKNHWVLSHKYQKSRPIYIPVTKTMGAVDGDHVVVVLDERNDGKYSGTIRDITTRKELAPGPTLIIKDEGYKGMFRIDSNSHSWVLKEGQDPIFVPPHHRNGAYDGDHVIIDVYTTKAGKQVGSVREVLRSQLNDSLQSDVLIGMLKLDDEGNGIFFDSSNPYAPTLFIPKDQTMGVDNLTRVAVKMTGKAVKDHASILYGKVIQKIEVKQEPVLQPTLLDSNPNLLEHYAPSYSNDNMQRHVELNRYDPLKWDLSCDPLKDNIETPSPPKRNDHTMPYKPMDRVSSFNQDMNQNTPLKNENQRNEDQHVKDQHFRDQHDEDQLEHYRSSLFGNDFDILSSLMNSGLKLDTPMLEESHSKYPVLNDLRRDKILVIDFGSHTIKIGTAIFPYPQVRFPTVQAKVQEGLLHVNMGPKLGIYTGFEALSKRGIMKLDYPFIKGRIVDTTSIVSIMEGLFQYMSIDPSEYAVLFTEAANHPDENRRLFLNILFDHFKVPFVYLVRPSTLALTASNLSTGCIVDIGHTMTSIVCVFDGFIIPRSMISFPLSGIDINEHFLKLILQSNNVRNDSIRSQVESLKEKAAIVSIQGLSNENPTTMEYMLSDESTIYISHEGYQATEILFQPRQNGKDFDGLHHHIAQSIQLCDIDLRKELLNNIILVGGTSLLSGLRERLLIELKEIFPIHMNIITPQQREIQTWKGGSMASIMKGIQYQFLSKEEYNKEGPSCINKKFV